MMKFERTLFLMFLVLPLTVFAQNFTTKLKTSLFPTRRMTVIIPTGTRVLTDTCSVPLPVFVSHEPRHNANHSLPAKILVQAIEDTIANQIRYFVAPDTLMQVDESILIYSDETPGDTTLNLKPDSNRFTPSGTRNLQEHAGNR